MSAIVWILIAAAVLFALWLTIGFLAIRRTISRRSAPGSVPPPKEGTPLADPKSFQAAYERLCEKGMTEVYLTSGGARLKADFLDNGDCRAVLLAHGYTSLGLSRCPEAEFYAALGFSILIPDHHGHGESEGKYIGMGAYEDRDLRAWLAFLKDHGKTAVVADGISMGSASVLLLTRNAPENLKAVVADCGYTSVKEEFTYVLKKKNLPAWLILPPARIACRLLAGYDFYKVNPIDAVRVSTVPILFMHGDEDDFVPYFMLDKLYRACASPKERLVIHGAGHAQCRLMQNETCCEHIITFLEQYGLY